MRLHTTFICALNQIEVPLLSAKGVAFADHYFITGDKVKRKKLCSLFTDALGTVESGYLIDIAPCVVYRSSVTELDAQDRTGFLEQQMIKDLLYMKMLQHKFWLVKDNCVDFDRGWIVTFDKSIPHVYVNGWSSRTSSASGSFDLAAFNTEELREARRFEREAALFLESNSAPTMLSKDSLRFQRYQYFIDAARSTVDVAMKIAQYCTALEALVSDQQQELSHQVSERVAFLASKTGEERLEVYKITKKAYGYRSKAVHGDYIKDKEFGTLKEVSVKVDHICRAIYKRYEQDSAFQESVEDSQKINEYFQRLILG